MCSYLVFLGKKARQGCVGVGGGGGGGDAGKRPFSVGTQLPVAACLV